MQGTESTYKNQQHFYNNELTEQEHNNISPLTIATKRIKYLGINLTKKVKDLYAENYVTLLEKNQGRHKEMER